MENKLCQAGLKREHAATVAEVLVYADARGIDSHGAVRVEARRGTHFKRRHQPRTGVSLEETGPCSAILHAMLLEQVAVKMGMDMSSKPPSKMALRWSVSAGWVTAAQSLILCSREPAPDSLRR
ncbi:Ldh family oxidoreductase, partial [Escherichia coli]